MKQITNHWATRVFFAITLSICLFSGKTEAVESLQLNVEHDSSYPNIVSISNIVYKVESGKYIDFSCDVNVKEPLTYGTKIRVNVSPSFPYAAIVDNTDFDMCFVAKKDMFLFRQLIEASNIPDTCPISAGVYSIRNFRLDLSRYPLTLRGFDVIASFQVHNGSNILSKFNARCVLQ